MIRSQTYELNAKVKSSFIGTPLTDIDWVGEENTIDLTDTDWDNLMEDLRQEFNIENDPIVSSEFAEGRSFSPTVRPPNRDSTVDHSDEPTFWVPQNERV